MAGLHFLVDAPPHRRSEREYALSVLLRDWLGIDYTIRILDGSTGTTLTLAGDATHRAALVLPDVLLSDATTWLSRSSLPSRAISMSAPEWMNLEAPIPVLYPIGEAGVGVTDADDGTVSLGFDLLGGLFFMLTRYEEYVLTDERDEHDRFPARASVAAREGWMQWPILDIYLHVFVGSVRRAWPGLELDVPSGGGTRIGHDVDHPASRMFWRGRRRLRVLAGDLFRREDPNLLLRRMKAFLAPGAHLPWDDPFNTFDFLMRSSEAVGIRSAFFFLTADNERSDGSPYSIHDLWAGQLLREIGKRGHRVGLHGSYGSFVDDSRLAAEWSALVDACRGLPEGTLEPTIRQHFLRWRPGATWPAQERAGLQVDETLGYADAIGYRAGTARSFQAYDLGLGRPLDLRVRPLHVMDATLLQYLRIGPPEAVRQVGEMAARTRIFGGGLSLLWHNSSLETASAKGYYLEILRTITG